MYGRNEIRVLTSKFETGVRRIIEEEKKTELDMYKLEVKILQKIQSLQAELLESISSSKRKVSGKKNLTRMQLKVSSARISNQGDCNNFRGNF